MAQFTSFSTSTWLFASGSDAGVYNGTESSSTTFIFDYGDGTRTVFHGTGFYRTGIGNIGWTTFTSAEHTSTDGSIVYASISGFSLPSPGAGNEAIPGRLYDVIMVGDDTLTGSAGNDQLIGGHAQNDGVDGSDLIFGGGGADDIRGGLGDDTIRLTAGDFASGETISGGGGFDTLQLENVGAIDLGVPNFGVDAIRFFSGSSIVTVNTGMLLNGGGDENSTFIGSAGVDALIINGGSRGHDLSLRA